MAGAGAGAESGLAAVLVALLCATAPAAADQVATRPPEARPPEARSPEDAARAPAAAARVVLARFTTSYAHDADHKARASNVELAAEAISGKVIWAGGVFSFNEAVGERTAAFGYAKSIVLRDGLIAEGVGGGACQVASTLHAAALLAGLDVVARAPHSRPSAYIRMGLDATVAMGGAAPAVDLKLKNPTPDLVTLHARAGRGALEIWLEAASASRPEVSLISEIIERTPFSRVVERDKRARDGVVRVTSFGIPGFRVKRTREIRVADGTARRDVRIDVYPPTREVLVVSPSFDESRIDRRAGGSSGEQGDTTQEPTSPPMLIDAGVVRPVLVQLRPSTLVVLDNPAR